MEDNEYVTLEQAIKLKELGFNYPCRFYTEEESLGGYAWLSIGEELNHNAICYRYSVPNIYQVAKWLRDKMKLHVQVNYDAEQRIFTVCLFVISRSSVTLGINGVFSKYEEALFTGISKALDIINENK